MQDDNQTAAEEINRRIIDLAAQDNQKPTMVVINYNGKIIAMYKLTSDWFPSVFSARRIDPASQEMLNQVVKENNVAGFVITASQSRLKLYATDVKYTVRYLEKMYPSIPVKTVATNKSNVAVELPAKIWDSCEYLSKGIFYFLIIKTAYETSLQMLQEFFANQDTESSSDTIVNLAKDTIDRNIWFGALITLIILSLAKTGLMCYINTLEEPDHAAAKERCAQYGRSGNNELFATTTNGNIPRAAFNLMHSPC